MSHILKLLFCLFLCYNTEMLLAQTSNVKNLIFYEKPYDISHYEFDGVYHKSIKLKDIDSKLILINFWASWCVPCMHELPLLNQLHQQYKDQGLHVILLNVEQLDREKQDKLLHKTIGKHDFSLGYDKNLTLYRDMALNGLPSTLFLDKGKNAYQYILGDVNWLTPTYKVLIEKQLK